MVQTSLTPSVWEVSHSRIDQSQRESGSTAVTTSAFDLVTDVSFVWAYPAKSAFVTGTFSNWETTDRMAEIPGLDSPIWAFSKALPPGDYQYKFIIDNVWRHAPDQHITFDERGIINNVLSVTVEACGDVTCFCSNFFGNPTSVDRTDVPKNNHLKDGIMTPDSMAKFQRTVGVAYKYVEREPCISFPFRKTYMHTDISIRPFDVTVVNVSNMGFSRRSVFDSPKDGTISRASSFESICQEKRSSRLDATVPIVEDAAYAALLNNEAGSLPHTAPNRAGAFSEDPTELAYSVRARLSSPILGFNQNECHKGIRLLEKNHCAVRVQERGLYKSVRGILPIRADLRRVYFEFYVSRQSAGGGVCLGLATPELPLNCLCGTRPNSVGFCTSGSLIRTVDGKETWTAFGRDVGSGSTVGCLVRLQKVVDDKEGRKSVLKGNVQFSVDGCSRGSLDCEFVGELDVFPTLSLFSKDTRVYSLFNGPDMRYASFLPGDEIVVTLEGQEIRSSAAAKSHEW